MASNDGPNISKGTMIVSEYEMGLCESKKGHKHVWNAAGTYNSWRKTFWCKKRTLQLNITR